MTEPHQQRRCNGCREWIDARAPECYLCGGEKPERNSAAVNAAHETAMNGHLYGEGNAALRDHAATRNIPTSAGGVGPSGNAYAGARGRNDLYQHFRQQLREATGN